MERPRGEQQVPEGRVVYEKEHDRFRCPEGKYLIPNPTVTENHKRYVNSTEDCRNCPQAPTCPAKRRTSTSHQRLVKRNLDQDLFEEVLAYMQESTFIERAAERMWKCEGLFAESKLYHCLARAKYRGRSKVQIQAYLCAIVQNLKRLLFPLYGWLLAHRWSYSTSTTSASHSNESRPPTNCQTKNLFALCNRPDRFLKRLVGVWFLGRTHFGNPSMRLLRAPTFLGPSAGRFHHHILLQE